MTQTSSSDFPSVPQNVAQNLAQRCQELDQEVEDAYLEIEELHQLTALLLGVIGGSVAYFTHHLIQAHQSGAGLPPETCAALVQDSLRRLQSTQTRFGVNLRQEIEAVLIRLESTQSLDTYWPPELRKYSN
jgi:hypothetical protein